MNGLRSIVLAISIAIAASSAASAQDTEGGGEGAAESRSQSFQAVEGGTREDVSGGALLLGAYGAILVMLIGYVGWLALLQQRTSRDLARLRTAVDRATQKS